MAGHNSNLDNILGDFIGWLEDTEGTQLWDAAFIWYCYSVEQTASRTNVPYCPLRYDRTDTIRGRLPNGAFCDFRLNYHDKETGEKYGEPVEVIGSARIKIIALLKQWRRHLARSPLDAPYEDQQSENMSVATETEPVDDGNGYREGDMTGNSEDGPVPPDAFRMRGALFRGLSPTPWRLVNVLWQSRERTCRIADLGEQVWQDHAIVPDEGQLGTARRHANSFFKKHKLPFRVSKKGDFASLKESGNA